MPIPLPSFLPSLPSKPIIPIHSAPVPVCVFVSPLPFPIRELPYLKHLVLKGPCSTLLLFLCRLLVAPCVPSPATQVPVSQYPPTAVCKGDSVRLGLLWLFWGSMCMCSGFLCLVASFIWLLSLVSEYMAVVAGVVEVNVVLVCAGGDGSCLGGEQCFFFYLNKLR